MGHRICGLQSIFNEPGTQVWVMKRKAFRGFFSEPNAERWSEIILEHTEKLVTVLKNTSEDVDMKQNMKQITCDIVGQVVFNREPNRGVSDTSVMNSIDIIISIGPKRAFHVIRNKLPFVDYDIKQRFAGAITILRSYGRDLIRERIRENKAIGDILDMIIECNAGDEEAMIDDVIIFLIAGYDTAANVLAFTLALILQRSDTTEKVTAETQRSPI